MRRSISFGTTDASAEAQMFTGSGQRVPISYDLPGTWGSAENPYGERLRLGLDADDADALQLCIDYLPNGRVASGTVSLDLEEGPRLALAILRLTSAAQGRSTSDLLSILLTAEQRP